MSAPPLFSAAKSGDAAAVEARKNAGDDLESCFAGHTPLAYAAQWEQKATVEKLLALGAKVDGVCVQDGIASTALRSACTAGNLEIVKLLVEHGANVDGVTHQGSKIQPLHAAASMPADAALRPKKAAIVAYLLGKGANANAKNEYGETALQIAKKDGFTEAATALEAPPPAK